MYRTIEELDRLRQDGHYLTCPNCGKVTSGTSGRCGACNHPYVHIVGKEEEN